MPVCLLPEKIEEFKKALVTRHLDLADLLNMDSAKRIKILEEYAGSNAKDVSDLIESKLVLKNVDLGIKNVLKKLTNTGKYSPEEVARLNRINSEWKAAQQKRIFSPEANESFFNGMADKMSGTEVTREEASTLFSLERTTEDSLSSGYDSETGKWSSDEARAKYEVSKLAYEKYYQNLLHPEVELSDALKEYLQEYKNIYGEFKDTGKAFQVLGTAVKGTSKALTDTITTLFNLSRKVLATADNSFHGTQGNQAFFDNPKAWFKELGSSFVRIGKELVGIDTFDAVMMRMYSDPNYINGRMQRAGITDTNDEIFPHITEQNIKLGDTARKVMNAPILSQVRTGIQRIDRAAESAFKGSSLLLRIHAFNQAIELAKGEGINIDDKTELEEIGKIINTSTGRGALNAKNPFDAVGKVLLWSARLLKSKVQIFSNPFTAKTPFAKKMAAKSLIKFLILQAAIVGLSKIFNDDETKTNPLDSRFGKIFLGDKRYLDTAGGRLALITLVAKTAQEIFGQGGRISAKDDSFVPYSNKPGGSTLLSDYLNFVRNRLSPGLGAIVDMSVGETSTFEEATPKNVFLKNFVPISGQTAKDIVVDGPTAERFIDTALNFIGLNVSDYSDKKTTKKKK